MSIDVADLPNKVRSDVAKLEQVAQDNATQPDHDKEQGKVVALRYAATTRLNYACSAWQLEEWSTVIESLGLSIAYLTASMRYEEQLDT